MRRAASAGGPPIESKGTKAIMAYLKGRGVWCFKVAGGPMQQRGVPDIICSVNGAFVALEVKRPELGRVTDLQALTIERIRESGGIAEVVTSVEEAAAVIEGLAEMAPVLHARWILRPEIPPGEPDKECSHCRAMSPVWSFHCHACGARMDDKESECDTEDM